MYSQDKSSISYMRWRNHEASIQEHLRSQTDEDQVTESEICTVTATGLSPAERKPAAGPRHLSCEETFTVDDALELIGFGRFQWKISFIAGMAWVGDAMEMMILSILAPQLHCEWRLPGYQVALVTSVVFAGMFIGAPVWGHMSDKYGRRIGLMISMAWTFYFGLLSAFAPVYGWFLFLRSLVGIGLAGAPQAVTLYSEFLPVKRRGSCIMMMAAFWSIGTVFEVLLALLIMPSLGWRWLLGLSTLPVVIFIICCFWLPESPRFDILTGRTEKAMKTIANIAKENRKPVPQGRISVLKQNSHGRIKELFISQQWRTTVPLFFIWFANAFLYYGVVLLTTEFFQARDSCGSTEAAKIEPICNLECKSLTSYDYRDLLWTTMAEFPGLLIVVLGVERIGRKKSMALCFFMLSLFILPLYACIDRIAFTIIIFIARAFVAAGFQVVFVYTPEVFPTQNRAIAMGICSAMSRIGSLITPFVSQVMLRASVYLSLSIYCGCSLLAGIACLMLPMETLGRRLQESLDQDATEVSTTTAADQSKGGSAVS